MASALLLFLFLPQPPNISCCGYVAGRPWPVESSPSSKHKHHGLRPPRPTSKLIYVRTVIGADLGAVKKYTGMADCLKKTVASNGFMSFYSDIGPSTIGIVVYRGAQFSLQDTLRAFSPYQKDFTPIGLASKFAVAQLAVFVSGVVSYPFDTMQRRLQIEAPKPAAEQMYKGMPDCFAKILKNEGPGGFFKGALASTLRGTGATLVLIMYDEIINAVTADQQQQRHNTKRPGGRPRSHPQEARGH